jgi:GNAT superfamily N-acetyltransferase
MTAASWSPAILKGRRMDTSQHLTTHSGFRFHVRPAAPADEGTVADFFTQVSRSDLRFRFLAAVNQVGHEQIVRMTDVDHRRSESFLAFTEDGSEMIATGMLACDNDLERGEVAIAVHEGFKRRGVSWSLLDYIARVARLKGVATIASIESRDNIAAINLEREMGFTVQPYPDDSTLVLVSMQLDQPPPRVNVPKDQLTIA